MWSGLPRTFYSLSLLKFICRLVDVEDPENLPEEFIRRLRVRAGASDTTQSRPIDLDDLTTRLEAIPPSPASTEDLGDEEYYRYDLEKQTECYNTLVTAGGRPSHPVSLGRDIEENPGEYREILSYWQSRENEWKVFESQWRRWREFRRWQQIKREEGRFSKYVEGVKGDLAKHGFTRSFQLDEDPKRQDKLTTWIEYLDYEYYWYDKKMSFVKRHQPRYNEVWKKLVDSKVLSPSETEEFIWNIDSSFQHASEEDRAERSVKSAKSAVISAQKAITDPRRSIFSRREPRQRLEAAQHRPDTAVKSLESIKRRNDVVSAFLKKTQNYRIAKEDAERRSILLRWVLEQVPLIELELNAAEGAENDSNGRNDGKRGSKRNRAHDSNEDRVSKRQRQDSESTPTSDRRMRASNTTKRESQLKHSYHGSINEGRASKRLKRNDQNHFPPHETSIAADPTPIEDPLSIQPPTTQDSRATATRSVKARSIRRSASNNTRSEAETPAKGVLDGKARVMKMGRWGGKSSNLSALGPSPRRRSTWMRKPPDRFQ
ncbi:hypothetical protein ACEPPN_000660 [Leptodophora sp. 'Broadleaf-Isolate-01']